MAGSNCVIVFENLRFHPSTRKREIGVFNLRFHPSTRKREIGVFENLRFHPSTRKRENGVFGNLHSGERFRKPPFSLTENAVYVWTQRRNGGKNLRFQKYPHTCGRGLKTRIDDYSEYSRNLNFPATILVD